MDLTRLYIQSVNATHYKQDKRANYLHLLAFVFEILDNS